jgi:hypothetical protein
MRRAGGPTRWLVPALILGVVIRMGHVLPHDFPLNDGGLFAAMADDIRAAGFHLPTVTSYNGEHIPFGYSPLGFYLVAGLAGITGLASIELLRWVPLGVTVLTVPAFALLARRILGNTAALVAAVVAFSLLPRSFTWLLMGGGLTRSLGFMFTILGLHQGMVLFASGRARHAAGVAVCAALVAMSHLGTLPFFTLSYALLFLAYGRSRRGLLQSVVAAVGALLLASPWWATVLVQHGLEPFRAAQATGGSALVDPDARARVLNALARFGLGTTGEPFFPVILVLAIAGAFVQLPAGSLLLPLWWVLTLLVDQRAGTTYAAVPVSLLAGSGVARALLPPLRPPRLRHAVAAALLAYCAAAAMVTDPGRGGEGRLLTPLPADQRAALRWIARGTPRDAAFLVLPDRAWQADRLAEWFPVLARRRSIATVQGSEWLAGHEFERRVEEYDSLRQCSRSTAGCLRRWEARTGRRFTHLIVPQSRPFPCCSGLLAGLAADSGWRLRYSGSGARIYERTDLRSAGTRARGAPLRSSAAPRGAPAPG